MIIIPTVNNQYGATTADIIVEQILLCKETIAAIQRVAKFRKKREIRDAINRRLRTCHDFMGMAGSRKLGCLYKEVNLSSENVVCEHPIPVTAIVDLYEKGVQLETLVFYPVSLISKKSDKKLQMLGLTKTGHDLNYPFMRYSKAGIEIETHFGDKIHCDRWTMEDHWKLIDETKEISVIRKSVLEKILTSIT